MNGKVLYISILLAMNCCSVNSDLVSIVKSSKSTISYLYNYYIKPLWTTDSSIPPDAQADEDISFYEHEDINYNYNPSIQDENVILMDGSDNQVFVQLHFQLFI